MNTADSIVVEILAVSDAIWRPMRVADWQMPTPAVIFQHRTAFVSSGVPWRVSGRASERQGAERALRELSADGLVELHGKTRRDSVKLTEAGEHRARALCGLPSVVESWVFLSDVSAASYIDPVHGPLCRELWLTIPPLENYGVVDAGEQESRLGEVQSLAAPALLRGWLDSRSDLHGRVWYSLTPAGLAAMNGAEPELPADLPDEADGAFRHYLESVVAFRRRLRAMKPDNPSEIGFIPLPASMPLTRPEPAVDA